jgi:phosphatidylserine decarboxylase
MTETSSGEFLTVAALVDRWKGQVATATLATWRSRNTGPAFVKVGGRVLYRLEDVEVYENKNTRCK